MPESEQPTPEKLGKPPVQTGLKRLWKAWQYSCAGFQVAWQQAAFRQELFLLLFSIPLALWLGQTWFEKALLIASVLGIMVVEVLNTAIEKLVDLVSPQWHPLAKQAKDLGSSAVLLACFVSALIWLGVIFN